MVFPVGISQFDYTYQIAPIVLIGGVAGQIPGSMLSVVSFTQASTFGPVTAPGVSNPLDAFVRFLPLAGSTIIDNELGEYPFANQQTAANAIITRPLTISFRMLAPAVGPAGFQSKQAMFQSLAQTFQQHNLLGGLYGCATPAYYWDNCVMRAMRDVTPEGGMTQRQVIWQIDFEKPLVTLQDAQMANNVLLSKISSGTQFTPDGTGALNAGAAVSSPVLQPGGAANSVSPPVQGPGLGFSSDLGSGAFTTPTNLATGTGAFAVPTNTL